MVKGNGIKCLLELVNTHIHTMGLNRCRKSCRLRWLNYLKPNIKRGHFAADEVDLIIRLHNLLGNRWSLIAGRLPGRTANDVKNYWNTHLLKKNIDTFTKTSNPKSHQLKPNTKKQATTWYWLTAVTTTMDTVSLTMMRSCGGKI
ncbi:hypothetical protein V6Z11_D07G085100 [Gossypium hirsutum]